MTFAKKHISAYEAMYEAQKIAYAPVIFQVVQALHDMHTIRICSKPYYFGVDPGPAFQCVIPSFQDKRTSTLPYYQSIPIAIKRCGVRIPIQAAIGS